MKPLILLIIGLVVLVSAFSLIFIYSALKSPEEWILVVSPHEIVIKKPVGRVVKRQVMIECISGEGVAASLAISGLTNASVAPQHLTLNKGDMATVTLTVKISKIGKEEGELTVTYGDKEEKVKIKVIGLKPRHPGKTEEQGGKEESKESEAGGEGTGGEAQQGWAPLQLMNIIIHADITLSGEDNKTIKGVTYTSSFTTHYVYSFRLVLYKKSSTNIGNVYSGTIELIDVSTACSEKFYHQIAQRGEAVAEVTINVEGCLNKMPEDQSLATSVEVTIDIQGRIIDMDVGYGDWILGDLTGTSISIIKGGGKTVSATKEVTKDLWITTIPLEVLIRTSKPKIGEVTTGRAETNTSEYPSLLNQFYAVEPSEPIPIEIEGTIAITKP